MAPDFDFSLSTLKTSFEKILAQNYKVITCEQYVSFKQNKTEEKILVNRVDVDWSCKKAKIFAELYNQLGIKGTFFIRLHGDEYNPFSFENYRCLKFIKDSGHEVGYHSEIIDQGHIWDESAKDCLVRDIKAINNMLDITIKGVASHGGLTGLNNLDFWKTNKPAEFGLLYEGYDKEPAFNLFFESLYVSDSNCRWKCYRNGVLQKDDQRTLREHCEANEPVVYSTLHPETYFHRHIYE
ncbi:MAG: hypothetical protein IAF38_15960 [Bacteroidia bacterium]|nr:hypothetical protein [Bacteroidia bacterium]